MIVKVQQTLLSRAVTLNQEICFRCCLGLGILIETTRTRTFVAHNRDVSKKIISFNYFTGTKCISASPRPWRTHQKGISLFQFWLNYIYFCFRFYHTLGSNVLVNRSQPKSPKNSSRSTVIISTLYHLTVSRSRCDFRVL